MASKKDPEERIIASNRKARHDYEILDTYEAGMVLSGTEVKSLREGKASLVDGFGQFYRNELFIENVYIPEYLNGSWTNHAARRRRKLLLHRQELLKIERKINEAGLTIVPLESVLQERDAPRSKLVWRGARRNTTSARRLREKQDNREALRTMRERNRGVRE